LPRAAELLVFALTAIPATSTMAIIAGVMIEPPGRIREPFAITVTSQSESAIVDTAIIIGSIA
jgi:hypothetical protein